MPISAGSSKADDDRRRSPRDSLLESRPSECGVVASVMMVGMIFLVSACSCVAWHSLGSLEAVAWHSGSKSWTTPRGKWTDEQLWGFLMGTIEGLVASCGRLECSPKLDSWIDKVKKIAMLERLKVQLCQKKKHTALTRLSPPQPPLCLTSRLGRTLLHFALYHQVIIA